MTKCQFPRWQDLQITRTDCAECGGIDCVCWTLDGPVRGTHCHTCLTVTIFRTGRRPADIVRRT